MSEVIDGLVEREYAYEFRSGLETDVAPKGLTEDIVRLIAANKGEPDKLFEWRLAAFHPFLTLDEPTWRNAATGSWRSRGAGSPRRS